MSTIVPTQTTATAIATVHQSRPIPAPLSRAPVRRQILRAPSVRGKDACRCVARRVRTHGTTAARPSRGRAAAARLPAVDLAQRLRVAVRELRPGLPDLR